MVRDLVSALKQIHKENTQLLKSIFYTNIIINAEDEDTTAEDNIHDIIKQAKSKKL